MQEEWTKYQIILPEDDYDEDDELDARLEEMERKKKERVRRGDFRGV
jgi:hypothetical protein